MTQTIAERSATHRARRLRVPERSNAKCTRPNPSQSYRSASLVVKAATPPHATRLGSDYLVVSEHADRLRAVRNGVTPAERVSERD